MDQGTATVLLFLVVVAIIFFLPLAMGPVHPPSFPVLLIFPVVLGAIWAFLNHATKIISHRVVWSGRICNCHTRDSLG
ncbi:uncharacterized protein LOC109948489 [Prunus persica]|uniref:uncharacterized protein LOC109948489 n=1 Tax=Prunus persica TaxID=3760 RepID=UPI0009AB871A|nr:uncharacterized protein LOC109948489 [Prunus persica]